MTCPFDGEVLTTSMSVFERVVKMNFKEEAYDAALFTPRHETSFMRYGTAWGRLIDALSVKRPKATSYRVRVKESEFTFSSEEVECYFTAVEKATGRAYGVFERERAVTYEQRTEHGVLRVSSFMDAYFDGGVAPVVLENKTTGVYCADSYRDSMQWLLYAAATIAPGVYYMVKMRERPKVHALYTGYTRACEDRLLAAGERFMATCGGAYAPLLAAAHTKRRAEIQPACEIYLDDHALPWMIDDPTLVCEF
jgi:hypothetical protein